MARLAAKSLSTSLSLLLGASWASALTFDGPLRPSGTTTSVATAVGSVDVATDLDDARPDTQLELPSDSSFDFAGEYPGAGSPDSQITDVLPTLCAAHPEACPEYAMPRPLSDRYGPTVAVAHATKQLCQLTGKYQLLQTAPGGGDSLLWLETPADTWNAGVYATDLGVSTTRDGRTYFFFGDTWAIEPDGAGWRKGPGWAEQDSWAFTDDVVDPAVDACPRLEFAVDRPGFYSRTTLRNPDGSGVSNRTFEVPSGAVTVNGEVYLFFTTDADYRWEKPAYAYMRRSVMARLRGAGNDARGNDLDVVYEVTSHPPAARPAEKPTREDLLRESHERGKFINIAPVLAPAGLAPLPFEGDVVFLFASSWRYQNSFVYLAVVPARDIERRDAWLFLAGVDADGAPRWSSAEEDALRLFEGFPGEGLPNVGELSAQYNRDLRQWLLFYGGAVYRSADLPWGPWSGELRVLDPLRPADGAACRFMHSYEPVRCRPGKRCACLPWENCNRAEGGSGIPVELCDEKDRDAALAPDATGWRPKTECRELTYADGRKELFLHRTCDAIHDAGEAAIEGHDRIEHEYEGGAFYGAYVVDAFTRPGPRPDTSDVYWTVSTWVPYQVHLMKTTFTRVREDGFEPSWVDAASKPQGALAGPLFPGVPYEASLHVPWDTDAYEIAVGDIGATPLDPSDPGLTAAIERIERMYGPEVAAQAREDNLRYGASCRRLKVRVKASEVDDLHLRLVTADGKQVDRCGRRLPSGDRELRIEQPGRYFLVVDAMSSDEDDARAAVGTYEFALEYEALNVCRQPDLLSDDCDAFASPFEPGAATEASLASLIVDELPGAFEGGGGSAWGTRGGATLQGVAAPGELATPLAAPPLLAKPISGPADGGGAGPALLDERPSGDAAAVGAALQSEPPRCRGAGKSLRCKRLGGRRHGAR